MKNKMNDGGPAFPLTRESSFSKNYEGMSLRAYLAGQALPAVIDVCRTNTLEPGQTREQLFAERAVCCADALIAELSKGASK